MVKKEPQCTNKISQQKEKNKVELYIETNRLHNIKRSIEKFLNKWTERKLSNLQPLHRFKKNRRLFIFLQWGSRFILSISGILSLNGYHKIGGTASIFFPLVDLASLTLRDKNDEKRRNWEDFIKDCESLGNDFDELTTIIGGIENFLSENSKNSLDNLGKKIYNFLKEYDKDKNKKISVDELKIDSFALDLKQKWIKRKIKKQLKEIVQEIEKLQRAML